MRIAFDLDDTLIPTTTQFSVGSRKLGFPASLLFKEELRLGAPELLRKLSLEHELWIYTTSLRKEAYVKAWFKLWGVKIAYVINQTKHKEAVSGNSMYSRFSKSPKFYDIDLLVDDLPGVEIECNQQGSNSVIVSPDDDEWAQKILSRVEL